jgi:phosphoesterase RecJ-like protein
LDTAVKAKKNFLTTHRSPDGDAVGSTIALKLFLNKMGKHCEAIVPDAFPEFLSWLPQAQNLIRFDKETERSKELIENADLIFSIDYNVMSRVGNDFQAILENQSTDMIIIDHHREPADHYKHYIHDIESSSTAQLVFDFIDYTGNLDKVDLDIAKGIYTGILTDTGSFRFRSTSYRTHEIAGKLIQLGLVTSEVYNHIYDNNSFERLRLLGYTLSQKMVHLPELDLAYIALSYNELQRFNYKSGDTEGFVNYALSIKGVQMSCLMKEDEDGGVKMSFRSKGERDVNTFARKFFNGGGHLNAAGGRSEKSLKETEHAFVEAVRSHF